MYFLLFRLRLNGYAGFTANVLKRHWQVVLLVTLLLPAGIPLPVLLRGLAFPVTAVFAPGHGLLWHLGYMALIQAIVLAWAMLQRKALSGGDFMRYAASLPISVALRRCVDLSLLFLVDGLLLVPVTFALALALLTLRPFTGVFEIVVLSDLGILLLVTQLAALEKNVAALPGILLADGLLGTALTLHGGLTTGILLALAPACVLSFTLAGQTSRWPWLSATRAPRPQTDLMHSANWVSPALRIQSKAIFVDHSGATVLRMGAALTLAVMTILLIRVFQFDGRSLPTAIVAMALTAMILSGFHRTLRSIHAPMQAFLSALPLGRHYWAIRDTLFIAGLGMLPLGVLLSPLLTHGMMPLPTLIFLILAYQALLSLLRLPLVWGGRHAVLFSVLLAGTWSSAAMAAIL